ncbi:MAG: lamin tail domain-containing protein [Myxococcaceae bacterium]|nr:lamin tail domain-containing protein [Myxococcaceae bacterium]
MSFRQLLLPLGLIVLTGCPTAPAPDPLPNPARVVRFTATPTTVARGGLVTLTWETENAVTVELVDLSRGALAGAADKTSGEVQVPVTEATVFVISARNARGARASSVASVNVEGVEASSIVFTAYPPVIPAGQKGLLVWNAPSARALQIAPMGGQAIDLRGQTTSGTVEIDPAETESSWVLTADGITRTATVVRGQAITEFVASKPQVRPGEMISLTWKTTNASKVKLSSPGRGVLREITTAADVAMGSFSDTLGEQIDGSAVNYVLEVEGRGPLQTKTVSVFYGTAPEILTLTAPPYVKENLSFSLTWTTAFADRVEVRDGSTIVYRSPNGAVAASGSVLIPAPAAATTYTVAAISSASGASATRTIRVTPVTDVTTPTLTAMPTTIATGGTPVTLSWNAPGSARTRILENGELTVVAVEGAGAAMGTATVYPNRPNTTYVLRATNTLEPTLTATASVTVTAPASASAADGGTIYQSQGTAQLAWTVGGPGAQLIGFGTPTARETTGSTTFVDISMTGTRLEFPANANDALLSFTPIDFETFIGGRREEGTAWVSTNGFIQFAGGALTNSRPVPQAIPSASTASVPESFVAPLWADLELGTGAVFWELRGAAPNRLLIVQWNRVRVRGQPSSSLTFQVRLHQAGAVTFEYQTMTLTPVPVSIGYQGPANLGYRFLAPMTPTDGGASPSAPAAGTRLEFAGAASSPAVISTLAAPGAGLVQIGTGGLWLEFDGIVKPTDLFISEIMSRPNPAVPQGQWLEIANFSNATVDVTGWQLGNTDGGVLASLPTGAIPPRGYLVIAATADGDRNDGLPAGTVAVPTFALAAGPGDVRVSNAQGFRNDLVYPAPAQGVSLTVDRGPFVNRGASASQPFSSALCSARASQTFGNLSPSQRGTPGASGEGACIGYTMSTIAVNFKDIAMTGSAVPLSSLDDSTATIDLSSAPVNLFGRPAPRVTLDTNGWLVPGLPDGGVFTGGSNYTNKVSPDSTSPDTGALIAPFWDDLRFLSARPGSGILRQRFDAMSDPNEPLPHWVIQWNRAERFASNDDLTFQVKLFDNGNIEFHYATMTSGSSANYGSGNDATIWLEAEGPAPSRALVYSVNRPNIRSNMAIRFTRVP